MGGGGVCVEKIKYACAPDFVPSGWMHIVIPFCWLFGCEQCSVEQLLCNWVITKEQWFVLVYYSHTHFTLDGAQKSSIVLGSSQQQPPFIQLTTALAAWGMCVGSIYSAWACTQITAVVWSMLPIGFSVSPDLGAHKLRYALTYSHTHTYVCLEV